MLDRTIKTARILGACASLALVASGAAVADDRSLLREGAGKPFLFVLFDTSSSMVDMPPCTRDNLADRDVDIDPFDATCTSECEMSATTCAQVCPDLGCVDYDYSTYTAPTAGDIITQDEESASLDGLWPAGDETDRDVPLNNDYRYDNDNSVLKSATYDPNIVTPGEYQIYLWWPQDLDAAPADGIGDTFASNTLVDVVHDGGTSTVAVDQRLDGGQWSIIGTYEINNLTLTAGNVTIRNENSNGMVVADGVRWVRIDRPNCNQTGYRCQQDLCPLGGCFTPLRSDDPSSKFFQAKSALHEVVEGTPNVHFGFATYQQNALFFRSKHWLYRVRDTDAAGNAYTLPHFDLTNFLETGAEEVFGNYSTAIDSSPDTANLSDGYACISNTGTSTTDNNIACEPGHPADLTDPWEVERARRVPKLGRLGTYDTDVWYRVDHDDDKIYNVTYSQNGTNTFGADPFAVDVEILRCPGGTCITAASCGNDICEVAEGENCENCRDDCRRSSTRCCGFNASESNSRSPDGCYGNNDYCFESGFDCSESEVPLTGTIYYDLVSDYMAQDGTLDRQPMREAGFFDEQLNVLLGSPATRCNGMEVNDDEFTTDPSLAFGGPQYNLRWSTAADARGDDYDFDGTTDIPREDFYDLGDRVPLDWLDTNQDTLLERLAPNTVAGGQAENPEDFRSAVYFNDDVDRPADNPSAFLRKLRLKEDFERPIISSGSTPLAQSIADFKTWYAGVAGTDDAWADFVAGEDALWACRDQYLLLLTDGLEECATPAAGDICPGSADQCAGASDTRALFNLGVETHVVGFGTEDDGSLSCLANCGGSELLEASNKDDLVRQLNNLLDEIEVEARSFASASIPAIQSSTADKIFLSSFVPLNLQSFWPGRIDAFRKPLPLTNDNRPDTTKVCADITDATDDQQSACHIWEAGEQLCGQAPESVDRTSMNTQAELQLGNDPATERRVFYAKEDTDGEVPNELQLFDLPPIPAAAGDMLDAVTEDLLLALDPDVVTDWNASALTPTDLEDFIMDVLVGTLEIKVIDSSVEDLLEGCELSSGDEGYILGDIFHANPTSIGSPGNFTYFAANTNDYRSFARQHAWRRKMLVAGTNDGQLHFFDSGVRQVVENNFTSAAGDFIELYNDGSGHELFSYIPRAALPILEQQVRSTLHIYSVDNTISVADVYIDPTDDGFDDTQWRTVLIGGMREGGDLDDDNVTDGVHNFKASYFALDVTQPDIMNPRQDTSDLTWVPCPASNANCDDTTTTFPQEYTPSCLDFFTSADGSQMTASDCPLPFPLELWTFADTVGPDDDPSNTLTESYYLDEDKNAMGVSVGNGILDLADLWSRPVIGQLQICGGAGSACDPNDPAPGADADLEIRHVAIFGGGMDPVNKGAGSVGGNYLYIVDVETGKAIYKRELEGSAAADPAVLDTDRDGVFDRIYMATTNGLIYKVDLTALDASGDVPGFDATFTINEDNLLGLDPDGTAVAYPGAAVTVPLDRITDPAWDPFIIFDSGGPYEATPRRGSPIYHAPAAFYIPELNQYGLAVGTGDREDLWIEDNGEPVLPGTDPEGGRFYVFVDEDLEDVAANYSSMKACDERLPITADCLKQFGFTTDPTAEERTTNYLLAPEDDADLVMLITDPRHGWYMTINPETRITAEAFIVAGVLVFPAFDPAIVTTMDQVCALTGTTRSFVVSAQNAGPVAPLSGDTDPDNDPTTAWEDTSTAEDRYHEIGEFTTAPFIDSTASKNPAADSATKTLLDEIDDQIADAVRDSLMDQYPRGSRFNKAFSLVIAALRSSTGVSVYTTIPIAVYPSDWKDQ